jgi:hypothetical protein
MDSPWVRCDDWSWTATMAGGFRGKDVAVELFDDDDDAEASWGRHCWNEPCVDSHAGIVDAVRGLVSTIVDATETITADDLRQLAMVLEWAEGLPEVPK